MNKWTGFDVENAKYIGEFEIGMTDLDADDVLSVVRTETHFVGGGVCNTGLLQNCAYEIDPDFSDDENLQEFISDVMTAQYNGRHFTTNRFTCNDRLCGE